MTELNVTFLVCRASSLLFSHYWSFCCLISKSAFSQLLIKHVISIPVHQIAASPLVWKLGIFS